MADNTGCPRDGERAAQQSEDSSSLATQNPFETRDPAPPPPGPRNPFENACRNPFENGQGARQANQNPLEAAQHPVRPVYATRSPFARNPFEPVYAARNPFAQDPVEPVHAARNPFGPAYTQRNPFAGNADADRNPFAQNPGEPARADRKPFEPDDHRHLDNPAVPAFTFNTTRTVRTIEVRYNPAIPSLTIHVTQVERNIELQFDPAVPALTLHATETECNIEVRYHTNQGPADN